MIKIIKTNNSFGIRLFKLFQISLGKNKGSMSSTISAIIDIWKFTIALYIGKESKNGKKSRQKIKESKNTYASA